MPIDKKLLDILCCPETKIDITELAAADLKTLNEKIKNGKVVYKNGDQVEDIISEGLVTVDKKTIYRIDEDIPIMLIDKGISFDQLRKKTT